MLQRTLWLGLLFLFSSAGSAIAQTVVPPGGNAYFGDPKDQPFSADAIFHPSPGPVIPPPVIPPSTVVGPDGGLLPVPEVKPKIWNIGFDIGLNGATGNSDLFNVRTGWNARRKTELNVLTSDFFYNYAEQDNVTNLNQAIFNARNERLFPGSKWSLFMAGQMEYDELRSYRFRIGLYTGAGYTVVDDGTTVFKLRGGVGAVHEWGSGTLADRWVPELVFGYDFRYKFSDRSSLLSELDYYPRVDQFSQFRLRARAGLEHILDPEMGAVMRFGVQDRYDSDPGEGKIRNDLTYFATFGIKF